MMRKGNPVSILTPGPAVPQLTLGPQSQLPQFSQGPQSQLPQVNQGPQGQPQQHICSPQCKLTQLTWGPDCQPPQLTWGPDCQPPRLTWGPDCQPPQLTWGPDCQPPRLTWGPDCQPPQLSWSPQCQPHAPQEHVQVRGSGGQAHPAATPAAHSAPQQRASQQPVSEDWTQRMQTRGQLSPHEMTQDLGHTSKHHGSFALVEMLQFTQRKTVECLTNYLPWYFFLFLLSQAEAVPVVRSGETRRFKPFCVSHGNGDGGARREDSASEIPEKPRDRGNFLGAPLMTCAPLSDYRKLQIPLQIPSPLTALQCLLQDGATPIGNTCPVERVGMNKPEPELERVKTAPPSVSPSTTITTGTEICAYPPSLKPSDPICLLGPPVSSLPLPDHILDLSDNTLAPLETLPVAHDHDTQDSLLVGTITMDQHLLGPPLVICAPLSDYRKFQIPLHIHSPLTALRCLQQDSATAPIGITCPVERVGMIKPEPELERVKTASPRLNLSSLPLPDHIPNTYPVEPVVMNKPEPELERVKTAPPSLNPSTTITSLSAAHDYSTRDSPLVRTIAMDQPLLQTAIDSPDCWYGAENPLDTTAVAQLSLPDRTSSQDKVPASLKESNTSCSGINASLEDGADAFSPSTYAEVHHTMALGKEMDVAPLTFLVTDSAAPLLGNMEPAIADDMETPDASVPLNRESCLGFQQNDVDDLNDKPAPPSSGCMTSENCTDETTTVDEYSDTNSNDVLKTNMADHHQNISEATITATPYNMWSAIAAFSLNWDSYVGDDDDDDLSDESTPSSSGWETDTTCSDLCPEEGMDNDSDDDDPRVKMVYCSYEVISETDIAATTLNTGAAITAKPLNTMAAITAKPMNTEAAFTATPLNTKAAITAKPLNMEADFTDTPLNTEAAITTKPLNTKTAITATPLNMEAAIVPVPLSRKRDLDFHLNDDDDLSAPATPPSQTNSASSDNCADMSTTDDEHSDTDSDDSFPQNNMAYYSYQVITMPHMDYTIPATPAGPCSPPTPKDLDPILDDGETSTAIKSQRWGWFSWIIGPRKRELSEEEEAPKQKPVRWTAPI